MIITKYCPYCGKVAKLKWEFEVAGLINRQYECGHTKVDKSISGDGKEIYNFTSESHKHPYEYQKLGAQFIAKSQGRALVADEMGLGKTIQFLLFVRAHVPETLPYLVVCKSGLRIQWLRECLDWLPDNLMPQVLEGETDYILPGVKGFIISMDMLRRFKDLEAWMKKLGIKTVCLDECQAFKNSSSKRTQAVTRMAQETEFLVGLSGTPIKNNAGEYYPILHMLRRDKFPTQSSFFMNWVDTYYDGYKQKVGGLKNAERFFSYTKDFMIRRTRKEVLPDLPTVSRGYRFSELGQEVEEAYKNEYKQFQYYYNVGSVGDSAFVRQSNILAYLSKMRHLTGLAKIDPCVDFVEEFIQETDRKIVIFVHHKDVGRGVLNNLKSRLSAENNGSVEPLELTADMDTSKRDEVVQKFWKDGRILVASELASGEGLNLQCASDCIMLERQWNPANEEQAEARFPRIGQLSDKVTATYFVAVGTVDEFFSELVEKKREIVSNALDGTEYKWDESSLVKELAEILAIKGGSKWGW